MNLSRYSPYTYALFRIVFGLLFLFHGLQKFGLLDRPMVDLMTLRGLAGVIELVGGTLIMLGLFTRVTAFICSGEMAAAYFLSHQPEGLWPILNRGELAALYCFAFLYVATEGPGTCSLDRLRGRR